MTPRGPRDPILASPLAPLKCLSWLVLLKSTCSSLPGVFTALALPPVMAQFANPVVRVDADTT